MLEAYLESVWAILLELSPPLLAGLLLAGLLHVWLPKGFIHRTMNRPGFPSTLRAVLVGVPMPLCSCGVLPTALGLKRDGASNGATTGFLISTPQTGVDSILVSAAFLGWPFALFKVAAAFVTGLLGGVIADRVAPPSADSETPPAADDGETPHTIGEALRYAVVELYGAIDRWIIAGVLIAAAISSLMPADLFTRLEWSQGLTGMLLMLAVSVPLYICAVGSVPIAASFVAAGMPTGTALVFLMAGPATNVATIGAIYRALGGRLVAVYLGTVIVMSIGLGLTFDFVIGATAPVRVHDHGTDWTGAASALVVVAMSTGLFIHRLAERRRRAQTGYREFDMGLTLKVEGMTCQHCVASVKTSLESVDGVTEATPDLDSGDVKVQGDGLDAAALKLAVETAGYKVRE